MALYALDDLDDAIDVTEAFLLPFDLRRWTKLALLAFFVGVPGMNAFPLNATGGTSPDAPGRGPVDFEPDVVFNQTVLALVVALVVAAVFVGLLFLLVGSILEFVLIESLRNEAVTIRRYWSRRWRQGLRLFGFRLVLGLVAIGPILLFVAIAIVPLVLTGNPGISIAAIVVALPLLFLFALLIGVVNGFTTAFVVPIMIREDCGVLAGWRRFWPTARSQWKQYLAYAVAAFVLSIAAGILIGIAMAAIAVVLLIPFGVLGAVGFGLYMVIAPAGIAVLAVAGLGFVLALLIGFALVSVPVVTYLRYYALLVLGDTNEEFDLIPGQRAAVRAAEST